jgi:hypothetical protein
MFKYDISMNVSLDTLNFLDLNVSYSSKQLLKKLNLNQNLKGKYAEIKMSNYYLNYSNPLMKPLHSFILFKGNEPFRTTRKGYKFIFKINSYF